MQNNECTGTLVTIKKDRAHSKYLNEPKSTQEPQIDFLVQYWSRNLNLSGANIHKCKRYAEALVQSVKDNIAKTESHLSILAEAFQENPKKRPKDWQGCKEYLFEDQLELKLPEGINIEDIYETFLEKKRDSFGAEGRFDECLAYHEKLALVAIFDETERQLISCYEKDADVIEEDALRIGIVEKADDELRFIDKTFAEYFTAKSLMREMQLYNRNAAFQTLLIDKVFSEPEFRITRAFLDGRLKKVVGSLPPNIFREYRSLTKQAGLKPNRDLIHILASEGTTGILQLIFRCIRFEPTDRETSIDNVPLEDHSNTLDAIQCLLQLGGVNIRDKDGKTPLHHAAERGQSEMVKFLAGKGANLVIRDDEGETPLHSAAWEYHLEVIKELVGLGVDVDVREGDGDTALISAAWRGRFHTVELLTSLGADVNVVGDEDNTALIMAASVGRPDIVEFLMNLGADIHARDSRGDTSLHLAASRGHPGTVRFLAERGADAWATDNDGQTPLHLAALSGELEIAEYLVGLGVDVEVGDRKGMTPLHFAAVEGNLDVVRLLVGLGVDVEVRNGEGFTARELAAEEGHSDTVKIFEELAEKS